MFELVLNIGEIIQRVDFTDFETAAHVNSKSLTCHPKYLKI